MAEFGVLTVAPRPGIGKGPTRAIRRAGKVPAVIYGANTDAQPIAIDFFGRLAEIAADFGKHMNDARIATLVSEIFIPVSAGVERFVLRRESRLAPDLP